MFSQQDFKPPDVSGNLTIIMVIAMFQKGHVRHAGKSMILIICLLVFSLFIPARAIDLSIGMDAPDFPMMSVEGKSVPLSSYRGQVVVLIYWRVSQNRSLQALEDGQDILNRFKDKGISVIGVTADTEHMEAIHNILNDHEIEYPVLLDPGRDIYGAYGIRVYPTTVIINRNGKISYGLPSHPLTYKKSLEAHIKYILGEIDEKEMHERASPHNVHIKESILTAHRDYNLSLNFTEARLLDMAMEAAQKSIEAHAGMAESHVLLGFLYLEKNEADKAFEQFNEALELNPYSHDAKTGLGGALILKGDLDRAIEVLSDAASMNPYPEMTFYELGMAYELKGEESKSKEMYKMAIQKIIHKKVIPSFVSRCR
jgi:peroxiredoxin